MLCHKVARGQDKCKLWFYFGSMPKTHFPALSARDVSSWLDAALYSLQVMTFLRPQDYILTGLSKAIYTAQSLLGPLLLGLFALTVRQRLKR